jgi:hypothetical protein
MKKVFAVVACVVVICGLATVLAQPSNAPEADGESLWRKVATTDKWGDVGGYHYETSVNNGEFYYYPKQKIIVALFLNSKVIGRNISISLRDEDKNTHTFTGFRDDTYANRTANPTMFSSITFSDTKLKKALEARKVFEFVIESGQDVIIRGRIQGGLPTE